MKNIYIYLYQDEHSQNLWIVQKSCLTINSFDLWVDNFFFWAKFQIFLEILHEIIYHWTPVVSYFSEIYNILESLTKNNGKIFFFCQIMENPKFKIWKKFCRISSRVIMSCILLLKSWFITTIIFYRIKNCFNGFSDTLTLKIWNFSHNSLVFSSESHNEAGGHFDPLKLPNG